MKRRREGTGAGPRAALAGTEGCPAGPEGELRERGGGGGRCTEGGAVRGEHAGCARGRRALFLRQ